MPQILPTTFGETVRSFQQSSKIEPANRQRPAAKPKYEQKELEETVPVPRPTADEVKPKKSIEKHEKPQPIDKRSQLDTRNPAPAMSAGALPTATASPAEIVHPAVTPLLISGFELMPPQTVGIDAAAKLLATPMASGVVQTQASNPPISADGNIALPVNGLNPTQAIEPPLTPTSLNVLGQRQPKTSIGSRHSTDVVPSFIPLQNERGAAQSASSASINSDSIEPHPAGAQPTQAKIEPRIISTPDSSVQNANVIPAASRAVQVDSSVRLEQLGSSTQPQVSPLMNASANVETAANMHKSVLAPPAMPAPEGEHDSAFSQQVTRGVSTLINQRGGQLTMRLDPPELGELRVHMSISRGVVAAEFHASTQQAQHLLEKHLGTLRTTLESQGLNVDRLSVFTSSGSQQSSTQHDHERFNDARQQRHDASDGQSRGRREHEHSDGHRRHQTAFQMQPENLKD